MKTTKITIGRLFNLGSYEHIRYEIKVEIGEGESARSALIGLEKIMAALAPERQAGVHTKGELEREAWQLTQLHEHLALDEEEFRRRHGFFEGTAEEYIGRCKKQHEENISRRAKYETRARKARELLDSLGGAVEWKDAKLDWEEQD